jgi:hypothetical protein
MSQPNYTPNFGAGTGMTLNSQAVMSSGKVFLATVGGSGEGSAWYNPNVLSINQFSTTFIFLVNNARGNFPHDGLAFAVHNDPNGTAALGGSGQNFGWDGSGAAGIRPSLALRCWDNNSNVSVYKHLAGATDSVLLFSGSSAPITDNGTTNNSIKVVLTYDGTTLSWTFTDLVALTTYSNSLVVDIPTIVGASTAYAGFTASSGGDAPDQYITLWTWGGTNFVNWIASEGR